MDEIVKHINDTNASYRTPNAGDAKNTDLFLDNEHYELFKGAGKQVTVRFSKENLSKAILFIASILPRKYDNSAMHKSVSYSPEFVYDQLAFLDYFFKEGGVSIDYKTQTWNARKDVPKKNGEIDNRFYFNGLLEEVNYVNSKGEQVSSKFTIRNYLAGGYSDLHIKKAEEGIFDVWVTNVQNPYFDEKEDGLEVLDDSTPENLPLQQIFYGAPGTGKSHTIDEDTNESNRIRTTFHPDYDYATFVGCYKPTMKAHAIEHKYGIYDVATLQAKFAAFSPDNNSKRITRFSSLYYNSLERMTSSEWQQIFLGFAKPTIEQDVNNGISAAHAINDAHVLQNSQITYSFVPQSFIKAYVEAWIRYADAKCVDKDFYLIIEEINRGNCAQIFGDLFQLLDRTNAGYSSYALETDSDLQQFLTTDEDYKLNITLTEDVKNDSGKVIATAEDVMNGKVLVLPPNLHIWATMNTSDQSLFPIDSAFKRRWDWKYMPIHEVKKANYKIEVCEDGNTYRYDWWDFLDKVNTAIGNATSSEDKKLGYFFCKADKKADEDDKDPSIITANRFVGKVIFYIWNDVFKDYDTSDAQFTYRSEGEDLQLSLLSYTKDEMVIKREFSSFFDYKGDADVSEIIRLLNDLKVNKEVVNDNNEDDIFEESTVQTVSGTGGRRTLHVEFGDETIAIKRFPQYLDVIKKIGLDKAESVASERQVNVLGCALISKEREMPIESSNEFSYVEVDGFYVVKGIKGNIMQQLLPLISDRYNLDLNVEYR